MLPTWNEEAGLEATLRDIPFERLAACGWEITPLVIDGGSTDRTLEVAATHGITVLQQTGKGKGGAVREALAWLHARGIGRAVILDADATYPGSSILPALDLLDSGLDLVVGVRDPSTGPPRDVRDLVHRVGNVLLNGAAGRLSHSTLLDICSGFWGVNVARSQELDLTSNGFGIEAELFLKASRSAWPIGQIPVEYRDRLGEPKLAAVSDGISILMTILQVVTLSPLASKPGQRLSRSLLRDLVIVSLIERPREVVFVCPPSLHRLARTYAATLKRMGLEPLILVQPTAELKAVSPDRPVRDALAWIPLLPHSFPRLTAKPERPTAQASVQFGLSPTQLRIQLFESPPRPVRAPPPPERGWHLPEIGPLSSLGRRLPRLPRLSSLGRGAYGWLDILLLLASQVKPNSNRARMRLLAANGLSVTETPTTAGPAGPTPGAPRPWTAGRMLSLLGGDWNQDSGRSGAVVLAAPPSLPLGLMFGYGVAEERGRTPARSAGPSPLELSPKPTRQGTFQAARDSPAAAWGQGL